jgi:hypothetical protein
MSATRDHVFARCGRVCVHCGAPATDIDHLIPIATDGGAGESAPFRCKLQSRWRWMAVSTPRRGVARFAPGPTVAILTPCGGCESVPAVLALRLAQTDRIGARESPLEANA